MTDFHAEFRRCLETLDAATARKIWVHVRPYLPQPRSDADALVLLHCARTAAESIDLNKRAYSHRWLLDNGYPSALPDHLKPKAERLYPKIVDAVGVASKGSAIAPLVQKAMADAVEDCYANGDRDPLIVKPRIMEVRRNIRRKLLGTLQ